MEGSLGEWAAHVPSHDPSAYRAQGVRRIRVVIVDDHALMREGTTQLLERVPDLEVAGQSGSAEEALEVIARELPDVALVDVSLPGMSGLDLARLVRAEHPEVAVLMLTAFGDYAYVSAALDAGVAGYLLKSACAKELIDAVRAVADGVFVLDRAISSRLAQRWREAPVASANHAGNGILTTREAEVLDLVARGLANKDIATRLGLGVRTIEGHVSSVLAKLGVASRTEAVRHALDNHLITVHEH